MIYFSSLSKRPGATVAGIFSVALSSILLLCGAGFTPTGTVQKSDINASGHNLTNAATVSATNVIVSGSLTAPASFTLPFSKITGPPTTLGGYGITDPVVVTSGSYANPSWLTSLAYAKLTGAPSLATVATSGAYGDLSGKPTLGSLAGITPTGTSSSTTFLKFDGTTFSYATPAGGGGSITLDSSVTAVGFALTTGTLTLSNVNAAGGLARLVASDGTADGSIAFLGTTDDGIHSIAIGVGSSAVTEGVAIGDHADAGDGSYGVAIGQDANAGGGSGAVAIGVGASSGSGGGAVGGFAICPGNGFAGGSGANENNQSGAALGQNASSEGGLAGGLVAQETGGGVAAGYFTSATSGAALGLNAIETGGGTELGAGTYGGTGIAVAGNEVVAGDGHVTGGKTSANLTARTAAVSSLVTVTPATTATYRIGGYVTVTAGTDSIQLVVSYTDENSNPQVVNVGLPATSSTLVPVSSIDIRALSGSPITISTTAGGTATYDVGACIEQCY